MTKENQKPPFSFLVIILSAYLGLCGCASNSRDSSLEVAKNGETVYPKKQSQSSVVSYDDYRDPLEPVNRAVFAFNDVTFRYALGPLARGYKKVTPNPVEKGIGNLFGNLTEPFNSLNSLLQGKLKQSGSSLLRFLVNSTIGIAGIFDVANSAWDLEEQPNTFGDTFAYYGAGYGAYIVIPFLGPSDLRSGTSSVLEFALHPIGQIDHKGTRQAVRFFNYFQDNASTLSDYGGVVDGKDDPYLFTRNLYLQGIQRDAEQVKSPADEPSPVESPE